MSNSFNISVIPEIAAVDAKIDIIDTIVDDIRDVDLPAHDTKLTTVDTVVDNIRNIDVPNIQTNIDANETKIDIIDGIADAIKLQTDKIPQKIRGHYSYYYISTASTSLITVASVTGQGRLSYLGGYIGDDATTAEIVLTLDGILFNAFSHLSTGPAEIFYVGYSPYSGASPSLWLTTNITPILLDFDTSCLIQGRRSTGTGDIVFCSTFAVDDL